MSTRYRVRDKIPAFAGMTEFQFLIDLCNNAAFNSIIYTLPEHFTHPYYNYLVTGGINRMIENDRK